MCKFYGKIIEKFITLLKIESFLSKQVMVLQIPQEGHFCFPQDFQNFSLNRRIIHIYFFICCSKILDLCNFQSHLFTPTSRDQQLVTNYPLNCT